MEVTGKITKILEKVTGEKDPVKLKIRQVRAQKEAAKAMKRFMTDQLRKDQNQ